MAEPTFADFAGQQVAAGVRDRPVNTPPIAFEQKSDRAALNQLTIRSLIPKISDVIIHEPKIWQSPLEGLIKKYGHPYGMALEQAAFLTGAPNKTKDSGCVPQGDVDMASQINIRNFAQNVDISVYDREIDTAVMNEAQAQRYFGAKMRLPMKTMSQMKYLSELQLLSDIVDGTRSVSSHTHSDGSGSAKTYSVTVDGYAGKVEHLSQVVAAPADGQVVSFANASDVTTLIKKLQAVARDFKRETDGYNQLGIRTFCEAKPTLVMDSKTLDAMDNILALDGADKRLPTRDAREYIGTFASIVEVPQFAALPTAGATANKRLGGVMFDASDFLFEDVHYNSMEAQRCANQRMTGYNYMYESTIGIWKGSDSYAFTFATQGAGP